MSNTHFHPSPARLVRQSVRRLPGIVTVCCALLLFCTSVSRAQQTGSISGTVRDTSDALVPGATVTLTNEASKATRTDTSNGQGFFSFLAVQPATYTVRIQMKNFEGWKVTGIEVHTGDSLTVPNVRLTVGRVTEELSVTATVAGVALNSPEHSTLITAEDIKRLSTVGRDAAELVSILPGFTINAGTGLQNQGADYSVTTFGGNLGAYGSNGAAPQQGLVNITSDGAQVIDPGDMGGTVANINMDQVQEVKVQTANFGADEAKGPIVINAVGKSGGSQYHGSLYGYLRNSALNANDWLSNYVGAARTQARYGYPGANVGGPVKVPGTHFNQSKRLVFWTGYEQYVQVQNANGGSPLLAFIPTPAMLGGDLSPESIASALSVSKDDLAAGCSADYSQTSAFSNVGGICWSPDKALDQNGNTVTGGRLNTVDPAVGAYTKWYPAINRVPRPSGNFATDGFNYVSNPTATHNGFQSHSRIDQNFSDSLKLYATFNWEKVNDESPLNNIYYNPTGTIPYPTPHFSNAYSKVGSINLTKTLGNSTTNELVATGVYFYEPQQFGNRSLALDTGTPWAAAGYSGGWLKNGDTQLPRIVGYESVGIPSFSMGYVPPGGEFLRKSSWNVADSITRVIHTHTIKAGIYVEQTRNNSVTLGSDFNGVLSFMRWDSCYVNQDQVIPGGALPPTTGLGNAVANFLGGCPLGYNQSSFDPSTDLYFNSLEGYATDEWKLGSKLTLTYGLRISHLPPWTDAHGVGAAVWDPSTLTKGVVFPGMTADTKTWQGISWHQRDRSIPVSGIDPHGLFYSPRVGIAYDLYGNGKTTFRGGFGLYRSHDGVGLVGGAVNTGIDLVSHSIVGGSSCTYGQLFNPVGAHTFPCEHYTTSGPGAGGEPLVNGQVNAPALNRKDNEQPLTYNYNFTVDQLLPYGVSFEVAYVGNQSTYLSTLGNLQNQNVIPLGAYFGPDPVTGITNPPANINSTVGADYRPYPNYQQVNVPMHTNWANYNALQASINKQRGSLVFGVNYTWSKSLAVRGNYDTGYIPDPVNPHHDYGITAFNRPQAVNFTYSYQEGKKFKGTRILQPVLNGWELAGITTLTSGPDLAVLNGSTSFGFSAGANYYVQGSNGLTAISVPITAANYLGSPDYTLQPTVTCNPRANLRSSIDTSTGIQRTAHRFVNGNCFGIPTPGSQGWWNLPDVHGPAYFKSDLSLYKDFQISERQSLQFRMAGFNFLNHPITSFNNANLNNLNLTYADPTCDTKTGAGACYTSESAALAGAVLNNANFGTTYYKVGQRVVEFGLKYNF